MNAVVEWLDSTEGQEWSRERHQPIFASVIFGRAENGSHIPLAAVIPPPSCHPLDAPGCLGPRGAAHDPCGRPPLTASPERPGA